MKERKMFLLMTNFNTIVCIDTVNGKLQHRHPDACPLNLIFSQVGQKLIVRSEIDFSDVTLSTDFLFNDNITVTHLGNDLHAVSLDNKFLSADKFSDNVGFDKDKCFSWEHFRFVSVNEFHSTRIKSERYLTTSFVRPQFKPVIPRFIHQIFLSSLEYQHSLPENVDENVKALKTMNPGWNNKIWFKKDIFDAIYEWYGFDMLDKFLRINPRYPAARADFFRYLCVYKMGGVYMDIKAGLRRPLDSILRKDDQFLLSHWDNMPGGSYPNIGLHEELTQIDRGEFQQWHVISAPGHPFLEQVILSVLRNIAQYERSVFGWGRMGVLRVTGPIAYSLAIHKIIDFHQFRLIESENEGFVFNQIGAKPYGFPIHYSELAGIIHQASFLIFLDGRCATRRRGGVTTHRPIWAGFGELGDVSALELAEIGTGRGQSPLSSDQQPGQSGQSVAENDLIRHRSRQMQAN